MKPPANDDLLLRVTPARIATADGKTLRFYLSPLDGPDFPWVDFDDVLQLSQLPPECVDEAKERWSRVFSALIRRLPGGVTIVPHACASGLFEWTRQWGWQPSEAAGRMYEEAVSEVVLSLYGHLPLTVFQDFLQKAALRNQPVEMGREN